jgi:DeoR family transcriptional regulator of aga operon
LKSTVSITDFDTLRNFGYDSDLGRGSRSQQILVEIRKDGGVSVEALVERLKVSAATIRRELAYMERRGLLTRQRGRAVPVEPAIYRAYAYDSGFQEQVTRMADEKRRIGLAAAGMIASGDRIAISAGTTTTEVARAIPSVGPVFVATNTINVAMELSPRKDIRLFVTGGELHGGWFSLVGHTASEALRGMYLDKAFLSVNGIDAERGLTDFHPDEAQVNRVMLQQARQKIVVADHTKFSVIAHYLIARAEEIDLIITDTGATDDSIAPFQKKGIQIQRV